MKIIRELLLLFVLAFILTSCNAISPGRQSNSQLLTSVKSSEVLSPFTQFENLKKGGDVGIYSEQVDNILRVYGIYDRLLVKVPKEVYIDSICTNVRISGLSIGNKRIAVLLIEKGHLYIYVMFSNSNDKWIVDGFTYQSERDKPKYRVEQSDDETRYWLVVNHEANRGLGEQFFNEIWYNPDGSVAGEFPVTGSTLFFPQNIELEANAYFSTSVYYNGDTKIGLSYAIDFNCRYKDRFQSIYCPPIREYWEFDLKTQQLKFISNAPSLPEGLSTMKHVASDEYGILQGYIDFYRTRLGDKKITTLGEWEKFMGLK